MTDASPRLGLPYLAPAQAQKHVTVNEALTRLDLIVQAAVTDRTLTAPPPAPVTGARHVVAAGATGDWAGQDGHIAHYGPGGWEFVQPRPGWQVHVLAEQKGAVFDGTLWVSADSLPQSFPRLGVSTAADLTNRLAVAAPATLLSHAGAGHQLKINKAAAGDTASLLYQTGFSGRAEIGLTGGDTLSVKVSADGSAWTTALTLPAGGRVEVPQGVALGAGSASAPALQFAGDPDTGLYRIAADVLGLAAGGGERVRVTAAGVEVTGLLSGTAVTQTAGDTTAGRLMKVGDSAASLSASPSNRLASGGTANAITVTSGAGIGGTPPTGLRIRFRADATNTGAATLALDGGTPRSCVTITGAALPPGYVRTNADTIAEFDGAAWVLSREIERGANANGEFTRLADGTQWCWRDVTANLAITVGLAGGFRSGGQNSTYPAVFVAPPATNAFVLAASAFGAISHGAGSSVNWTWAVTAVTSQTAADRSVQLLAAGRWY